MWEDAAGWWQATFTQGADAEYTEQILPLAARHLAGAADVLDVGTGEGQVALLAVAAGAGVVVGIDPTAAQLDAAAGLGAAPAYARADAAPLPFPSAPFDA